MLNELYSWFIDPFTFEFFTNALLAIIFISVSCALVSCYLILKGWSLYGDVLSHAVLPGIILSLLAEVNIAFGIFAMTLLVTFCVQYLRRTTTFNEQTVLSINTSFFMGVGFLIYYTWPQGIRIQEILFGKIIGLNSHDVMILGVIAAIIALILFAFWKTFNLIFFDATFAKIIGLRTRLFELLFYILIAISVMTSLRSVGALLIVSLLITPGAFAYIISKSVLKMFFISSAFSIVTAIFGIYCSYHYEVGTGAVVISSQFILFLVLFFVKFLLQKRYLANKLKNNLNYQENSTVEQCALKETK